MRPDHEVYQQELRLADLVEPLGYDSIWGVEHHFTDYTMCPDVLQFLNYMAGRTERARRVARVGVPASRPATRRRGGGTARHPLSRRPHPLPLGRRAGRGDRDRLPLSVHES